MNIGLTSLRYRAYFYQKAIPGLIRRQRLILPDGDLTYRFYFRLTPKIKKQWLDLYEVDNGGAYIPFTYFWSCCVKSFLCFIRDLGINYRNILHLKNEIFFSDISGLKDGELYVVETTVEDLVSLPKGRAVVVGVSRVLDAGGHETIRVRDSIFFKNVSPEDGFKIQSSKRFPQTPILNDFMTTSGIKTSQIDFLVKDIFIPENMGLKYGNVSGDLNPVHTNSFLTRLFGYKKVFIQGLCTTNYLIKIFSDEGEKLEYLKILFHNPIFTGQTVQLKYDPIFFHILDHSNKVLAWGERKLR